MARPGLTGHRKFRRLVRALDAAFPGQAIGRPIARGYLELLWDSCYESGEEYVGTADDIETLVGWTGERGMLTRALVEAGAPEGDGFLEPVDGTDGFRVHDLWHHAPDYVGKRRKRELERQQKSGPASDRRTAPNGAGSGAFQFSQSEDGRTPSPSPSPSHSPSPPHGGKNASAEPNSAPAPRRPFEGCAGVFLVFPTIGPVREFPLSEAQVAEWAALYSVIDVRLECRKALAWLKANPGRQKTARGMTRFLNSWLARAVDSGRGSRAMSPAAGPVSAQGQANADAMRRAAERIRNRAS
jgi:hypothetical protein